MKYIIDLPDEIAEASVRYWKEATDMTLVPYTEDEVWSLAREIAYCMSLNECEDAGMLCDDDIYTSATGVLDKLSYQEAKAKYDAWKEQKQKEDNEYLKEVTALAEKIGIHKLYSMVKEIRGE